MALTQDGMQDSDAEYAKAFESDDFSASSGGDAGGISLPGESGPAEGSATGEDEPAAIALVLADGEGMRDQAEQAQADATTTSASEDQAAQDQPTDPKEIQRMKSWEGRMRAREEELARREAALKSGGQAAEGGEADEAGEAAAESIEAAAESLEKKGDQEGAERVEQVADKVESGEMTAEQAMQVLANDFGPEFVKMIEAIAVSKAQEAGKQIAEQATGELGSRIQEVIESLADDKAKAHFEAIASKHPDFDEVAKSPEFAEFVKTYPGGEEIAANGSAADINQMLDSFKEAGQQSNEPDPAIEAAEGVRSTGMRLPEKPKRSEGFEEAWNEF